MSPRNYRPNSAAITLPGACLGHQGQVIADLHDPLTGAFVRAAVVADVGSCGLATAQRYCDMMNGTIRRGVNQKYVDQLEARSAIA